MNLFQVDACHIYHLEGGSGFLPNFGKNVSLRGVISHGNIKDYLTAFRSGPRPVGPKGRLIILHPFTSSLLTFSAQNKVPTLRTIFEEILSRTHGDSEQ
jgi:hypothetical protein